MQSRIPTQSIKCGRRTRGEYPCKNWALPGQTVCRMHGGSAKRALANAEERMRALVYPAVASLQRQIDAGEFPATRYVLDWAGFKAADKVEGTGEVTIRIVHEDQPIVTLDAPYASLNGHSE